MKRHIPNTITCCNLVSGCIATYYAFDGMYFMALQFIIIGAVFDFFDGMSARLLHVSSDIGKELDSLADDITFGFAPSAMVFKFLDSNATQLFAGAPWASFVPFTAFIVAAFSAVRLAKFNLDARQTLGFIGLPTPANALFWGALIHYIAFLGMLEPYQIPDYWLYIVLALIPVSCFLLVSEIPMFALKFKTWGWRGNEIKYIFILSCVFLLLLLSGLGIAACIAWYIVLSIINNHL